MQEALSAEDDSFLRQRKHRQMGGHAVAEEVDAPLVTAVAMAVLCDPAQHHSQIDNGCIDAPLGVGRLNKGRDTFSRLSRSKATVTLRAHALTMSGTTTQ